MRYFFRVEYDGTAYGGWQHQTSAPTIQDALEKAFSTVTRTACRVTGAGRTDAGVHARGQGAHIEVAVPVDISHVEYSVNALLPRDIAVYNMQRVEDDFHARFSALSRKYRYTICTRKQPLLKNRAWPVYYALDWDHIRRETAALLGTHDFSTFCSSGSGARHARCTVTEAHIEHKGDCHIFTIAANRFVYTMVRSLMGTLIDMGRGKVTSSMTDILNGKDRGLAGFTAPACGLTLENVTYQGVD